jgi:superfamily I DNA and/or RNA helicase
MYEICSTMPGVEFQQQFIEAELLQWPSSPLKVEHRNVPSELLRLNNVQKDIVERLQQNPLGIRLLVGPPGTGKTTTAVSWIINYAERNPDHRILVSAPSNQAVHVLLAEVMRFLPVTSLALTGTAKKLTGSLPDVYVHGYPSSLCKPLVLYKNQIECCMKNRQPVHEHLKLIHQCLKSIKEKLTNIFDTPTQMRVKSGVRSSIKRFKSELFPLIDIFCLSYRTPSLVGVDGSGNRNVENGYYEDVVKDLEEIISLMQKNAFYLESFMLQRSQIIFSTLIAAGRKSFRKQIDEFSMVLLDEAAQALVPEALIPLYFKPRSYIQFGDPSQLPATITSQAARNKGYENSMMHWLINEFKQPHEMLTIQYRMDDEICRWVSRMYYENKLITAPYVNQRKSILHTNTRLAGVFKHPSLFFDIKGQENRRGGSDLSASCSNLIEAKAVIDMVYYLIMKCGFQPTQIGIISFYSAQIEILNETLLKAIKDEKRYSGLEIKTVDGFQGGEKDIVLISAVRTSESVGFLNDWRRLNVAMSRPKYGRWVFGKVDSLQNSNSDFPSLLAEHQARNTIISEEQLRKHIK